MQKTTVLAPTVQEAEDKTIQIRLWLIYKNLIMPHTSRREWLDLLSLALIRRDIQIVTRCGTPFEYAVLEEIFVSDPVMRWLSLFLEPDPTGSYPKRFPKSTLRIQMLILYSKIEFPTLGHHLELPDQYVPGSRSTH